MDMRHLSLRKIHFVTKARSFYCLHKSNFKKITNLSNNVLLFCNSGSEPRSHEYYGNLKKQFKDKVGEIILGTVKRFDNFSITLDIGKVTGRTNQHYLSLARAEKPPANFKVLHF